MKLLETNFNEYVQSAHSVPLHTKLQNTYNSFPDDINELKNIIFYGPSGVGKYSQMLLSIMKYSKTELKYEKKMVVSYNKSQFFFKISDIHFEIDMGMLGCNSKVLWNDIFNNIVEVLASRPNKVGIVVCKNFHKIHGDLLDIFYSYMQETNAHIKMKYIFISEQLSFISDIILQKCHVISIPRPSRLAYNKILPCKLPKSMQLENITNIKQCNLGLYKDIHNPEIFCDEIINYVLQPSKIQYLHFRDIIYDILVYNNDIYECIWYIIRKVCKKKELDAQKTTKVLMLTYSFLQLYNNNYRPIYHLESFLFKLISIIHEL